MPTASGRVNVLIVEDQPSTADSIREAVYRVFRDANITLATNLDEFQRVFGEQAQAGLDLVLIDLWLLPSGDLNSFPRDHIASLGDAGYRACAMLRQDFRTKDVSIIICTETEEHIVHRGLEQRQLPRYPVWQKPGLNGLLQLLLREGENMRRS